MAPVSHAGSWGPRWSSAGNMNRFSASLEPSWILLACRDGELPGEQGGAVRVEVEPIRQVQVRLRREDPHPTAGPILRDRETEPAHRVEEVHADLENTRGGAIQGGSTPDVAPTRPGQAIVPPINRSRSSRAPGSPA